MREEKEGEGRGRRGVSRAHEEREREAAERARGRDDAPLVLEGLLVLLLLVRLLELLLALALALGAGDVEGLALVVLLVELVDGLRGVLVLLVVDEAEALGLAVLVDRDDGRRDLAERLEDRAELGLVDLERDVLDVQVGEPGLDLVDLGLALALGDVDADEDDLVVEEHAVDALDGGPSGLGRVVVDEAVPERVALAVDGDLARQDVAERGERVVERLVVDVLVEVLDEDVAGARLAERRVALRPHDAARAALDRRVVELLEGALAVVRVEVVDVGVAERAARDGVAADPDRRDGADHREDCEQEEEEEERQHDELVGRRCRRGRAGRTLVEHGLGDGRLELADVERRRGRRARVLVVVAAAVAGLAGGRGRLGRGLGLVVVLLLGLGGRSGGGGRSGLGGGSRARGGGGLGLGGSRSGVGRHG